MGSVLYCALASLFERCGECPFFNFNQLKQTLANCESILENNTDNIKAWIGKCFALYLLQLERAYTTYTQITQRYPHLENEHSVAGEMFRILQMIALLSALGPFWYSDSQEDDTSPYD